MEIIIHVPSNVKQLSLILKFGGAGSVLLKDAAPSTTPGVGPAPILASGRTLPNLLFILSAAGLAKNIGNEEAATVVAMLSSPGTDFIDVGKTTSTTTAEEIALLVRSRMKGKEGVVLIGGYDLIPAQRLDTIDVGLRRKLHLSANDPDDFVVWSDDVYGDTNLDGVPEIPVSRIPDGRSSELLITALQAKLPTTNASSFGLRNFERPFADDIFRVLPNAKTGSSLLCSKPTIPSDISSTNLQMGHHYFMLHGSVSDSTRYWGENAHGTLEAFNLTNLSTLQGTLEASIILAGCCWGALIVEQAACQSTPGVPIASRTPEGAISLAFLKNGANAFIGCTGAHYSPKANGKYFGEPMHRSFWIAVGKGEPPAKALFLAKQAYLADYPHGQVDDVGLAIEAKLLRQFTCLGLGW